MCGNDTDLRAEFESLLKAHGEAGDFLESPAIDPEAASDNAPSVEDPGTKIGHYELLELIGEGGMGLVYLAEQKEPVRRKVALKIVKLGMDTKEVVARFETERQTLALLEHPNIAHVSAGGSTDRTIRVWDASSGAELMTLHGHSDSVRSAGFSSDGGRIVSGSKDKTIKVWDLAIDRTSVRITDNRTVVALSPDGKWISSGDGMGITTIWNRSTCTELMTLHGPKGDMVAALRFSPDGKRIFSCHICRGTVWDIESGTELMSFSGHAGYVHGTFSPDGRYIASWISEYWDEGHDDNTIKLRDAATGEEIMTLDGFEGEVWWVVFSPDSRRLASCELNGTIKVWDAQAGENTMTLRHNGGALSVAFSPDGYCIASGGVDETIRLWDA